MSHLQAESFLKEYGFKLSLEQNIILKDFISLFAKHKLFRIMAAIQNRFLKQGMIQIIGEVLFI